MTAPESSTRYSTTALAPDKARLASQWAFTAEGE